MSIRSTSLLALYLATYGALAAPTQLSRRSQKPLGNSLDRVLVDIDFSNAHLCAGDIMAPVNKISFPSPSGRDTQKADVIRIEVDRASLKAAKKAEPCKVAFEQKRDAEETEEVDETAPTVVFRKDDEGRWTIECEVPFVEPEQPISEETSSEEKPEEPASEEKPEEEKPEEPASEETTSEETTSEETTTSEEVSEETTSCSGETSSEETSSEDTEIQVEKRSGPVVDITVRISEKNKRMGFAVSEFELEIL